MATMTRDEMTTVLRLRRELTGDVYNQDTVTAWCDAFDGYTFDVVHEAMITAAKAFDHVTTRRVIDNIATRTISTAHTISCECAGEGLLSSEVPDDHNPGQTYTVWRTCPGARKRTVPNPGPEMSWHEYLTLEHESPFDEADHRFARTTAQSLRDDPDAIPLRTGNPLNVLVARYTIERDET